MPIRRAKISDVDGVLPIARLLRLKNAPNFYWHTKKAIVEAVVHDRVFVYELNDNELEARIVAFLWLKQREGGISCLEAMAVSRKMQNCGIGEMLVKWAEKIAKKKGNKKLVVFSFCRYKVAGFYTKMGFRRMKKPGVWSGGYRYYRFYKNI